MDKGREGAERVGHPVSGVQGRIDDQLQRYYSTGGEARRLQKSLGGRVEFVRTLELIRQSVPEGSRIADVGGANGVYAAPLAAAGYDVVLIDPVPYQVAEAQTHGAFEAVVGDARALPLGDSSVDACVMLGPLYHLQSRADRVAAIREAARVTRPGGVVLAAVISRLSAFQDDYFARAGEGAEPWRPGDAELLATGWIDAPEVPFPFGHFHTGPEVSSEFEEAGLPPEAIHGVEGPMGLALEFLPPDHPAFEAMLDLARETSLHAGLREAGPHLLVVARVR